MENRDDNTPETGRETDISKSQAGQQPTAENRQSQSGQGQSFGQSETGQGGQSWQSETSEGSPQDQSGGYGEQQSGQAGYGNTDQADTTTQQRSDVEGASAQAPEKGEAESGFIGTEGSSDTSSELVEDQDYAKDGQGAPEGK